MLEDMQIESGSDLQLVTPSLSFQGADARGGAFNIRGITNLAVSATAESGVEIHVMTYQLAQQPCRMVNF